MLIAHIYIEKCIFGSKLLFKQVLLKTRENLVYDFQLYYLRFLVIFLDLDGKGIVPYLPKRFRPYFW